jgi:uncharacterized membrane protein
MLQNKNLEPRSDSIGTDEALTALFYAVAILLIGGIVHIASLLLLPRWSEHDAYARVASFAKLPLQTVAGPPASAAVLSYRDPALATTYCLYDLSTGPVRVSISAAGAKFLALSMHSRHGRPFYALTGSSASHGVVALTLATEAQIAAAETRDADDETNQELRVLAPETKGFVQVQVLAATPSGLAAAEQQAGKLICSADKQK